MVLGKHCDKETIQSFCQVNTHPPMFLSICLTNGYRVPTFFKKLADIGQVITIRWVLPRGKLWGHLRGDLA